MRRVRAIEAEERIQTGKQRVRYRQRVRQAWARAVRNEGVGEWEKILKWFYRLMGKCRSRQLRRRAIADVVACPRIVTRIANYMRVTGTDGEYVAFVRAVCTHPEQVYSDVPVALLESLLRLEADAVTARRIRSWAMDVLRGEDVNCASPLCRAVAPLLILRFGDRRSIPALRRIVERRGERTPRPVIRGAAIVLASFGVAEFRTVRRQAAKLVGVELRHMVRLIEQIQEYNEVPDRYKARLNLRDDVVADRKFFDMRSVLAARLLSLNTKPGIRSWLEGRLQAIVGDRISRYDTALIRRLL